MTANQIEMALTAYEWNRLNVRSLIFFKLVIYAVYKYFFLSLFVPWFQCNIFVGHLQKMLDSVIKNYIII